MNKFKKTLALSLSIAAITPNFNIINTYAEKAEDANLFSMNNKASTKVYTINNINYEIVDPKSDFRNGRGTVRVSSRQLYLKGVLEIPDYVNISGIEYNVIEIQEMAFYKNKSIQTVKIGRNVEKIASSAFAGCENLSDFKVAEGNTKLSAKDGVLFDYKMKTLISYPTDKRNVNYTIPETIEKVSDYAFYSNDYINNLQLSLATKEIGSYAFYSCSNLESVATGNYIEKIGDYAFASSSLKSIRLPYVLSSLGHGAFSQTKISSITIPSRLEEIPAYAFYNCYSLRSVSLTEGVKTINEYAFYNTALERLNIPKTILSIGYKSFAECSDLKQLNLGEKLKKIDEYAFYNCLSLESLVIPKDCNFIGNNAFTGAVNLSEIDVNFENNYFISMNSVLYTRDFSELILYPPKNSNPYFNLPADVSKIRDSAFSYCYNITEFTVDTNNYYFFANDGILYRNDNSIIQYPLAKISYNLILPDFVSKIENRAFAGALISTIYIPADIREIGEYAFEDCKNVKSFEVNESNKYFKSQDGVLLSKDNTILYQYPIGKESKTYKMPDTVNIILPGAFKNSSINNITLSSSLAIIGDEAFRNTKITNIEFSNSIKSIGDYAFSETSISKLILPDGIEKIGNYAFSDCQNLRTVVFESAKEIDDMGYNVFYNSKKLESITVPINMSDYYKGIIVEKNAENYKSIIKTFDV